MYSKKRYEDTLRGNLERLFLSFNNISQLNENLKKFLLKELKIKDPQTDIGKELKNLEQEIKAWITKEKKLVENFDHWKQDRWELILNKEKELESKVY